LARVREIFAEQLNRHRSTSADLARWNFIRKIMPGVVAVRFLAARCNYGRTADCHSFHSSEPPTLLHGSSKALGLLTCPSNGRRATHMLRHACGYKLANDGVDTRTIQSYLGHKSIQHTVRYTELAPTRFKSLFRD
jgi:Phage integrase family